MSQNKTKVLGNLLKVAMNKEELFFDVTVIGSGMGALTTACLLAKRGYKVAVLEQNYLPGGCISSYWRKGFVFESRCYLK